MSIKNILSFNNLALSTCILVQLTNKETKLKSISLENIGGLNWENKTYKLKRSKNKIEKLYFLIFISGWFRPYGWISAEVLYPALGGLQVFKQGFEWGLCISKSTLGATRVWWRKEGHIWNLFCELVLPVVIDVIIKCIGLYKTIMRRKFWLRKLKRGIV